MLKAALTGSMAAGKSEAARAFARLGVPVFDADAAVHVLYAPGGKAVRPLQARFPGAVDATGGVNRRRLARILARKPRELAALEAIVHPLVEDMRAEFLHAAEKQGAPYVILDIPLLFETNAQDQVDRIILVTAPEDVRRARAFTRPGMTQDKWQMLESRQMPQEEKTTRADFVITTAGSLQDTVRQVHRINQTILDQITSGIS